MANYLHKEHKKKISNFFHDLVLVHWLNFKKKLSFAVLIGALCAQCENLADGLRLTYENASFSQVPYNLSARMAAHK
jgi:hypothetical protein